MRDGDFRDDWGGRPEEGDGLEVWLFDKNDIRTVTKVLMSEARLPR